jgi:hypothetical protein
LGNSLSFTIELVDEPSVIHQFFFVQSPALTIGFAENRPRWDSAAGPLESFFPSWKLPAKNQRKVYGLPAGQKDRMQGAVSGRGK